MANQSIVRITKGEEPGYYVKMGDKWCNIDKLYPKEAAAIKRKYEEILKDKLTELRAQGKHHCLNYARGFNESEFNHFVVSIDTKSPANTPNPYKKKTEIIASVTQKPASNQNTVARRTPSNSSRTTASKKKSSSSPSRSTASTSRSSSSSSRSATASASTNSQSQSGHQNGSDAQSSTATTQILPEPTRSFVAINENHARNPKPKDLVVYEVLNGSIYKVTDKNGNQIPELQQMVYNATKKRGEEGNLPTCESEWNRYYQNGGEFLHHAPFAGDSYNKADWERYIIALPKEKVGTVIREARNGKNTAEAVKSDSNQASDLLAARQDQINNAKANSENTQIQTDTKAKEQTNMTLAYASRQSGGRS